MDMEKCALLARMVRERVNCPLTSSTGRLFDAVASLLGICDRNSYEGQAPMELEAAASESARGAAPVRLREAGGALQIDVPEIVRWVVESLRRGAPPEVVSAEFHDGLCAGIVEMCRHLRERERFSDVGLSGGVFQNKRLFESAVKALEAAGFSVLTHELVPPNDGCIPLGQAAAAASRDR
jgi:hydrogenase maturation protein HypF